MQKINIIKLPKEQPIKQEESKPTSGQLFREQYGFSKSLKRAMLKNGFNPFDAGQRQAYRKARKQILSK